MYRRENHSPIARWAGPSTWRDIKVDGMSSLDRHLCRCTGRENRGLGLLRGRWEASGFHPLATPPYERPAPARLSGNLGSKEALGFVTFLGGDRCGLLCPGLRLRFSDC